jgi:hypothetical protein
MNKPTRILTAIVVSLLLGGMFAYQDAQKNEPPYQQHPVVCIATDFFGGSLSGLIFYFGSGWLAKRKERKLKQPENDKYYDEVARELQDKPMVPGLWTKAFAEMGGDEAKARALYIKYRVAQLAEEERIANMSHAEKEMMKERAIREASEKAFKKKEEQRRILIKPFTFELFKKEYRGEIPLHQYGRTEQQQMFETWQMQKLDSVGFFNASPEKS